MKKHIRAGIAGAIALAMLGLGTPALADAQNRAAIQEDVTATSGELHWGVRESIRNYLENFDHTGGSVSTFEDAEYHKGDKYAKFPLAKGTIDADSGTADLSFKGRFQMFAYEQAWLDFRNVRVKAANGKAQIIVDMINSWPKDTPKTTKDNMVLATFDVPAKFTSKGGEVTLASNGEGRFGPKVPEEHLPSMGGSSSYDPPNDQVDPFSLTVKVDGAGGGGSTDSIGKPYSDTTAYMVVKPGKNLSTTGETKVRVEGHGYDRDGRVYLGFGKHNTSDLEKWRRSKGGVSGPAAENGQGGDYDYGLPRFVLNYEAGSDEDVADAKMDKDGNWSIEITLPGPKFKSFFGTEIDCEKDQCGFFSFGAHGVINAKNEAFTPVSFGQKDTVTPPPGETKPPVEDKNPAPTPIEIPKDKGEPFGESTGKNDTGATLTVSPAYSLKDEEQVVKLTGKNYATSNNGNTFGGAYVLFGWIDSKGEWRPSHNGRGGIDYTYQQDKGGHQSGVYQKMVNYPGNKTEPGMPFMDAKGNWEMEFPIAKSQFTSAHGRAVDCYRQQCGILTIGAHGQANAGVEVFTPVYFTKTAEETKNETPGGIAGGGLKQNPNFAQGGGLLAKTGASERIVMLSGLLVLSAAALVYAQVHLRRRSTPAGLTANRETATL